MLAAHQTQQQTRPPMQLRGLAPRYNLHEGTIALPSQVPGFADNTVASVWHRIRSEALTFARDEPLMGPMIKAAILDHETLGEAIAFRVARKLADQDIPEHVLREAFLRANRAETSLERAAAADSLAAWDRDPACTRLLQPLMYFKGFLALQAHRYAHHFWCEGRRDLAFFIQSRVSEALTLDIHPAARIGQGVMLDHAHSVVIGETAVVGDNVSILHSVTLGGTGKEDKDRHPKVGDNVVIGAGATILGNIRIGNGSKIAAGSVVLKHVEVGATVVGVPARQVGCAKGVLP